MAVALLGGSSLQAAVILPGVGTLDIDFRDASWNVPSGVNSFSVGGITATAKPKAADLTRDIISGLGVDGNGHGNPDIPNEIDVNEELELLFLSGSGLGLSGVWLANLFPEPEKNPETAVVSLTLIDSTIVEFKALGTQTDGVFFLDFGGSRNVSKINFSYKTSGGKSDYSVVGFSVPEGGSTLLVLGMALVSLAGMTSYQRRLAM